MQSAKKSYRNVEKTARRDMKAAGQGARKLARGVRDKLRDVKSQSHRRVSVLESKKTLLGKRRVTYSSKS